MDDYIKKTNDKINFLINFKPNKKIAKNIFNKKMNFNFPNIKTINNKNNNFSNDNNSYEINEDKTKKITKNFNFI